MYRLQETGNRQGDQFTESQSAVGKAPPKTHCKNRLWNWVLIRSLTNSFFGSSDLTAWFLNITSSSHLFLTANELLAFEAPDEEYPPGELSVLLPPESAAWRFNNGFPKAACSSADIASDAALSRSCYHIRECTKHVNLVRRCIKRVYRG